MDKFDRIYRLHRILAGKRTPIPFEDLRERLGRYRLYVVSHSDTEPKLEDSIKAPAGIAWHEVIEVQHCWLEVGAMAQPMRVEQERADYHEDRR